MKNQHLLFVSFFVALLLLFSQKTNAQFDFIVEPCADSAAVIALVDTVFLAGMPPESIANITFYGNPTSVGYYTGGYFLGFDSDKGMIMTNGKSDDADKSNTCNTSQNASTNNNGVNADPDLDKLSGGPSYDACIIEFDYKSADDTVRFNYVFASEEYHEYVFQYFNDMFGFFLSGPGIEGPYSNNAEYVALIPNSTTGVTINTVNFGKGNQTCTGKPTGCTNCELLIDNSQSSDPAFNKLVYDAFTKPLVASLRIAQGEWQHIKMAIGDGSDAYFDSGVMLEKGSFTTSKLVGIEDLPTLKKEKRLQSAPNPFSRHTTISAQWDCNCDIRIEVYNNTGQRVKVLKSAYSQADAIQLQWIGDDENGMLLPPVIYNVLLFLNGVKTESLRVMKN